MADTYTSFIDDIRLGGFNAIEYADEGLEMYISFQALLRWISKYPNMFSGMEQIIEIDWRADKPMFVYSTTVSCNLQKCYIQNEYLNTTLGTLVGSGTGIGRFDSISEFNDPEFTKKKEDLEKEANPITNPSIFPSIGNINYVYLNINFLSQLIAKGSDNKDNKVTIRKFLQDVCDGVNKALGSINDLQVISNVDGTVEKLTIIDYQQKRIKNLVKLERPYTELKAQGLGSMLTKIQAQSSITPDLASMIAIGAQAQGQVVGPEAASFSKLSTGFIDRIYPEKNIGDSLDIVRQERAKEAIEKRYKNGIQSYIELIKNQQPKDGLYDPIILESTDTSNKENIAVELYKACLEKFTETRQTSTAFIPIKLNLSLYGLSGIKIYQNFKLSNDILPLSYKGNFVFTTLGVSHTVDSSKWETNISALIGLKDEKVDTKGDLIPFTIPLPEETTGSSTPPRGTTAYSYLPYQPPTRYVSYVSNIEQQTRNQPLQDRLFNIIKQAAEENQIFVEIFSAGQDPAGAGARRTGSKRHDNGYAADIHLKTSLVSTNYLTLNDGSPEIGKVKKFAESLLKFGIHTVSAGNGYMNSIGMHIDIALTQPSVAIQTTARYFGGKDKKGKPRTHLAPKWIQKLFKDLGAKYPVR